MEINNTNNALNIELAYGTGDNTSPPKALAIINTEPDIRKGVVSLLLTFNSPTNNPIITKAINHAGPN